MIEKRKIILYVDDDADDQIDLVQTIHKMNAPIRIACAMNGVEALRYLERAKLGTDPFPSLILMDINMPMMTGKQVLQKLKQDEALKSLPVVMYTTSSSEGDKAECLRLGAEGFLTKPFSQEAIQSVVAHCLSLMND